MHAGLISILTMLCIGDVVVVALFIILENIEFNVESITDSEVLGIIKLLNCAMLKWQFDVKC